MAINDTATYQHRLGRFGSPSTVSKQARCHSSSRSIVLYLQPEIGSKKQSFFRYWKLVQQHVNAIRPPRPSHRHRVPGLPTYAPPLTLTHHSHLSNSLPPLAQMPMSPLPQPQQAQQGDMAWHAQIAETDAQRRDERAECCECPGCGCEGGCGKWLAKWDDFVWRASCGWCCL